MRALYLAAIFCAVESDDNPIALFAGGNTFGVHADLDVFPFENLLDRA